jgi:hypothetical protein
MRNAIFLSIRCWNYTGWWLEIRNIKIKKKPSGVYEGGNGGK